MNNAYIIYSSYFDFLNQKPSIGGIQSYISDLCILLQELKQSAHIIQGGEKDICSGYKGIEIIQYKTNNNHIKEELANKAKGIIQDRDLVIFASDTLIAEKTSFKNSIAIQHGIYWDIPPKQKRPFYKTLLSNAYRSYCITKRLKHVNTLVCVDYNFQNWYRTQTDRVDNNIKIIPNYSRIPVLSNKPENRQINIIFARRLIEYRGTKVFTEAIKRILDEKENIIVTVAGTGPDKEWMRNNLSSYDNVNFIEYESKNSLEIHKDKDIAVVPTVGSEGTSLSLLEAMASRCAVICSDVGGMTNIILDEYNGLIVKAGDPNDLYQAIKRLIHSKDLLTELATNGYNTIIHSFSYELWKKRWKELILESINQQSLSSHIVQDR